MLDFLGHGGEAAGSPNHHVIAAREGVDPYSDTWRAVTRYIESEIMRQALSAVAIGTGEREADEIRGRVAALRELLSMGNPDDRKRYR